MSPAKHDTSTKEKLLGSAQKLMLHKGYPSTSIDEICEGAGVTKGSFFHYFESKEHLGKELLERFAEANKSCMCDAPFAKEPDPLKRIYLYLDFTIEMSKNSSNSCLLGTFAQELSETHPEIRACCEKSFDQWSNFLKHELEAAKKLHHPKINFEAGSLADHFIAILQGSFILTKAHRRSDIVEKNLLHFKQYLKTLFGTNL